MKFIFFVILFIFILNFISINCENIYYISSNVKNGVCDMSTKRCGQEMTPFGSIAQALKSTAGGKEKRVFLMQSGVYSGRNNKDIMIDGQQVEFMSYSDQDTIIDCQGAGSVFTVYNSTLFMMNKLTVKNCIGAYGGVLHAENSNIIVNRMTMINNDGAGARDVYVSRDSTLQMTNIIITPPTPPTRAVPDRTTKSFYIDGSMAELSHVTVDQNLQQYTILMECQSSTVQIDRSTRTGWYVCGNECSVVASNGKNVCPQYSGYLHEPVYIPTVVSPVARCLETKCGDRNCQEFERYTCESDCGVYTGYSPGFRVDTLYSDTCTASVQLVGLASFDNLFSSFDHYGYIKVFAYFRVPSSKNYHFSIQSNDVQVNIDMDNAHVFSGTSHATQNTSTFTRFLEGQHVHSISITLLTLSNSNLRSFNLDSSNSIEYFYSKNYCGDGVYDGGNDCIEDKEGGWTSTPVCGDGICNEVNIESCLTDCHQLFTVECNARSVPRKHMSPGYPLSDDTLGDIISNQLIWHHPGSEHMAAGVDIVTGQEGTFPVFYFDHCTKKEKNLLQDVYRQSIYELPEELTGGALPRCTFETKQSTHSGISDLKQSMIHATSIDGEVSGGGGWGGYKAEASAAFAQSSAVSQASSLSVSSESTIISTTLKCSTSSVEMVKHTFHPRFLEDLAMAKSVDDMYLVVRRYGTHFYETAVLGGSLEQMTIIENTMFATQTESEWQESASRSFSAAASAPVMSASASYGDSQDTSVSGSRQQELERQSTRSTVIAKGGEPGSFGPDSPNQGRMFRAWAKSLDFLPVPIDYKLRSIRSILPRNWKNQNNLNVSAMWMDAELKYYEENQFVDEGMSGSLSTVFISLSDENVLAKMVDNPSITVSWRDPTGIDRVTEIPIEGSMIGTNDPMNEVPVLLDFQQNRSDVYIWDEDVFKNATYWNIGVAKSYSHPSYHSLRMPYRFDFSVALPQDNFFTSTIKPTVTIKLPDLSANPSQPYPFTYTLYFVNWQTSHGFVVNSVNHAEWTVNDTPLEYTIASLNHYWSEAPSLLIRPGILGCQFYQSSGTSEIAQVQSCLGTRMGDSDIVSILRGKSLLLSSYYGYNLVSTPPTVWKEMPNSRYEGEEALKYQITLQANDYYGSKHRLNWILLFEHGDDLTHNPNGNAWLRPIKGHYDTTEDPQDSYFYPSLIAQYSNQALSPIAWDRDPYLLLSLTLSSHDKYFTPNYRYFDLSLFV